MSLHNKNLQAFKAIVVNRSVHGAAKELFITQTAVTQRLKALEEHLKVSLFERSRRGMLLTPEGAVLLRYCDVTLDLEKTVLSQIQRAGIDMTVNLVITGATSFMQSHVTKRMINVINKFPQLLLEFIYRDDDSPIDLLREGKAQFAIVGIKNLAKEMKSKILRPEAYVLVASPQWAGRKLKDIVERQRIIDYNPMDEMTFNYLKHYDLLTSTTHERHFANHPEAIVHLVSEGIGYSVLEKSFAEPYIKSGKLHLLNQGKTYLNEIALAWYERPVIASYFSAVIEAIE